MVLLFALILTLFRLDLVHAVMCEQGLALPDPTDPTKDLSCSNVTPCPKADLYTCTAIDVAKTKFVCCPTKSLTCTLPVVAGTTCGSTHPTDRYYFDPTLKACTLFTYNGCFGNENNFQSVTDCDNTCSKKVCKQGMPAMVDSKIQVCTPGATPSTCEENFECTASTEYPTIPAACCPTGVSTCDQLRNSGKRCPNDTSFNLMARWYYSSSQKACLLFNYLGCEGNDNNFATLQLCQDQCISKSSPVKLLCPLGFTPSASTTITKPCIKGIKDACGKNYSCMTSADKSSSYCCSDVNQYCPAGSTPAGDTTTNECIPNQTKCPDNYSCKQKDEKSKFYCCSDEIFCPPGSKPYMNENKPVLCSLTSPTCPAADYTCKNVKGDTSTTGYCCSPVVAVETVCPVGSNPLLNQDKPVPCTINPMSCTTAGYTCLNVKGDSSTNGYCCSTLQPANAICPKDTKPQLVDSKPVPCTTSKPCSSTDFTCQNVKGETVSTSYCCTKPVAPARNSCPSNFLPLLNNDGQFVDCASDDGQDPDSEKCSGSSICLPSETKETFICCKIPTARL